MESVILVNIGSGSGSLPVRRQAITCARAYLLSVRQLGTIFNEIVIYMYHTSGKYSIFILIKWYAFPFAIFVEAKQ